MPRNTLRRLLPSPARLKQIKSLGLLGDWVYQSNVWHINRYSASMGCFIGLFVAFLPIPGQMIVAALLALVARCNLPLSVALVWVTNPVTMPAIYYLAYRVGAMLIEVPVEVVHFELSWEWLTGSLVNIWRPFLLGCLVCGVLVGSLGYFVISMLWRWRVTERWHKRKRRRQTRRQAALKGRPGAE